MIHGKHLLIANMFIFGDLRITDLVGMATKDQIRRDHK